MHHIHTSISALDAPNRLEQLSALMDGECSSQETAELIQALDQVPGWQQTWHDFDTVGSALRAHAQSFVAPVQTSHSHFVEGVMARLQAEVTPMAPDLGSVVKHQVPPAAANDSVFRWKLVASFATMSAVVSLVWQLSGVADPAAVQIAAAPAPVEQTRVAPVTPLQQVQSPQGLILRNPDLEALMAAHRQYGGMTALQMPAGFLRTATFDPSVR